MTRASRPFARFYYRDFQRDYPDVYADDAAFAAWMRLLVLAETAWPAPPELPRSLRRKALEVLVSHGLIAIGPRHTYAVRGYQIERSKRQESAQKGATNRWANGHANADAEGHADA